MTERGTGSCAADRSPAQDDRDAVTAPEPQPKDYRFAQPEAKILAAAVRGDPAATQTLLAYLRPLVFRYCLSRLGGRGHGGAGTDDCAQDILLAVLAALPGYRLPPDRFLPFVFGIARHKVVDVYRGQTRDRTDSVADLGEQDRGGRDPGYAEIEGRLSLSALLATLPPLHQEILAMRVILGYSAQETAEALDMPSAGAVRVTQHRALATLRRRMAADAAARSADPHQGDG
ncbi:MAG: rpoE [Mycobacterium sp.]|nr:rpoE [Mycobacterium sp.]